ncbi:hypothetical protein DL96DRAFT_1683440 [Flagelloscypha sp. PMI_526]|nr:hypothetical protein DL96DRAFT_1683440 [Flagelloscypha sp. PMI_526]
MSLDAPSSALGLASLNMDLIDLIFSHLPDFKTLRSTILISKQFSLVFHKHPKSIVRRIALKVAGPPLDDFLTLVRFEKSAFDWDIPEFEDQSDEEDALSDRFVRYHDELPEWQDANEEGQEVQLHEIGAISKYAERAHILEEWFSFRRKARVPNRSLLTPMESHKFLRAIYRLMLFQKCFAYSETDREGYVPDLRYRPEAAQRLFAARREFLSTFGWEELHEIQIVAHFILEMEYRTQFTLAAPDKMPTHERSLLQNLEESLNSVRGADIFNEGENFTTVHARYLTGPLEEALQKQGRKLLDPSHDHFWMNVLDSAEGQFDACERCSEAKGLELWNQTNWSVFRLHAYCNENTIPNQWMPRLLSFHLADRADLQNAMAEGPSEVLLAQFHETYSESHDDWKKEDWLCETCLVKLIKTITPRWWINKKIDRGEPIPSEDCWYGWNCETMTHNSDHASKLNHFCEPTRGGGASGAARRVQISRDWV